MRVFLAGYNIDEAAIRLAQKVGDFIGDEEELTRLQEQLRSEPWTPETISAAFARVSRSDKPIRELRAEARDSIARTRRSNERIVFEFGHSSVAEHAVFNLEISEISRLALEYLEHHRLASYTEASQRFIWFDEEFVVPKELKRIGLEENYITLCRSLFQGYRELATLLDKHFASLAEQEAQGKAKEDARYLLPLSCKSRVGMTLNARVAERVVRSLTENPLTEVQELGVKIGSVLKDVAPSLIRYTQPENINNSAQVFPLDKDREWKMRQSEGSTTESGGDDDSLKLINNCGEVRIISFPSEGDILALSAFMFKELGISFSEAYRWIKNLDDKRRQQIVAYAHANLTPHHPGLREWELGQFVFEIVLSASAYAQLKRHRMTTQIVQPYDTAFGVTIPPSVLEIGWENRFRELVAQSNDLYERIISTLKKEESLSGSLCSDKKAVLAAQYCLTNAHRRRIIFASNARELIHLSRLREDHHAQWDLRMIVQDIIRLARDKSPLLMSIAGGKDAFKEIKERLDNWGFYVPGGEA